MESKKINNPLLNVIRREFHRIAERKTLYFLIILLPLGLFTFLSLIYIKGVVRELPVAVIDKDNSELSRLVVRSMDATSSMKIVMHAGSIEEVKEGVLRGKLQGAFYIPEGFEKKLKGGQYTNVSLYKSTASLIVGNLLYKDGVTTLRTISGGVLLKKLRSRGLSAEKAMAVINPIRIDSQSLFNPNYSYLSYLLPGLVTALVQMIIMITSVLIISSEFTHHTFPELYAIAGKNIFNIVAGKSIPHLLLHYATAVGIIGLLFPLFGIELHGILLSTLLFMFLFITAVFFLGLLISCMFHEQLLATELALFINTPAFIFSGFTFPLWSMPAMHNYFAQIIPFTHFLNGFIKIYQMNAPIRYAVPEIKVLSAFLVVSLALSFIVLHYQTTRYLMKGNNSSTENNQVN